MRMRRKTNLPQRMQRCAHLLIAPPDTTCSLRPAQSGFGKLHVEIGCGKGRFVNETALRNPDVFFIAMEKTSNVLISAMERTVNGNIANLRYINAPAECIMQFFTPGEVSRIYLNFPDPWPSRRHMKRRLTACSFLAIYKEILSRDGEIFFKTDNLPLFEFSLKCFADSDFALPEISYDYHKDAPIGIMTEYEKKFYEQGMPICFCRAVVNKRDAFYE